MRTIPSRSLSKPASVLAPLRTRIRFALVLLLLAGAPASAGAQILFGPRATSMAGHVSSHDIAAGDVNGDGFADLVLTQFSQPLVHLGDGAGAFGPAQSIGFDLLVQSVALADVDGDGVLDLLAANASGGKQLFVLPGLGDGTFAFAAPYPLGGGGFQGAFVESLDADGDGDADVVAAAAGINLVNGSLHLFLNDGTGALTGQAVVAGGAYHSALAGDLDADGLVDVVAGIGSGPGGPPEHNSMGIELAQAGGGFFQLANYVAEVPVALTDLDGDGTLDLVSQDLLANTIVTRFGVGDGTFRTGFVLPLGPAAHALLATDLDGDGPPDILLSEGGDGLVFGGVRFLHGAGDGQFGVAPAVHVTLDQDWFAIKNHALADVDGDGRQDVVATAGTFSDTRLVTTLNRSYPPGGPLLDLGHQLKGGAYWPIQIVSGAFDAGDPVVVSITGLTPAGPCHLVVGASEAELPFKGGVLVPQPDLVWGPLHAGPTSLEITAPWPAGMPSGATVTLQAWMVTASDPSQWSATSATRITAP